VIALDLTKKLPKASAPVPLIAAEPTASLSTSATELQQDKQTLAASVAQKLPQDKQLLSISRQAELLSLAQNLLPMGNAQASARLLKQIDLTILEPALLGRFLETRAAAQLALGDSFGAIVWLHQAQVLAPATNPQVISKRLQLKASAYLANGLALGAAKALIQLSQIANNEAAQQYNERIWNALNQVSAEQLKQAHTDAATSIAQAWFSLALLPLLYNDLNLQLQALEQWRLSQPEHPASLSLPRALVSLADLSSHQPKRIALALPLQGRLGKIGQAVVDGFMAARYNADQAYVVTPYVKVYDTSILENFNNLYALAKADRIQLIIGPLDKDKVIALSQKEDLDIPTLALNYIPIDGATQATPNLIQFGLAVEDEAAQLAQRIFSEGHKRILILHQDKAWAIRAAEYFDRAWAKLGGDVAAQVGFSGVGDHSDTITKALLIQQSYERANSLRKHLAVSSKGLKFEPRRRQDIDAIVLFSLPTDGRQIVPTLAFHYAADLPIYASHHIFQGPTSSNRDRDLNKVIFTDLPWLLEKPPIQQQVSTQWPEDERYTRLFALGVDAYRLFPRLEQLQAFTDSRVHGVTGLLKINPQGRIQVQSSWGQFVRGQVRAAPR
jgi:hypothetical protein